LGIVAATHVQSFENRQRSIFPLVIIRFGTWRRGRVPTVSFGLYSMIGHGLDLLPLPTIYVGQCELDMVRRHDR
jgi:hypothetical protein